MSMRNYAVSGCGIILNGLMESDELEELADSDTIGSQFSFTGEAFPLKDDGVEEWGKGESFNDETIYFVELPKLPRLFSAAYTDMHDLVSDMRRAYRRIKGLPKISDYRQRIRSFSGTYYG